MEEQNIYLVRSPEELLGDNLAGYGWARVNFSEAGSAEELLERFAQEGINPGRRRKQILRFFAIAEGDIVVVPLQKAVAIGFATGERSHATGVKYGENRIGLEFLRNEDKSLVRIARSELPESLSTRLRVRTAVVSLNEFREDILRTIDQVKSGGGTRFSSRVLALEAEALKNLQQRLLENIRNGKTNLESGGYGLESLVVELLKIEGYSAKIQGKRTYDGAADADIKAFREQRFSSSNLLIQVKHHTGVTSQHALRQLQLIELEEDVQRWIITTGEVTPEFVEEADSHGIGVMDGGGFIGWLIENAQDLSPAAMSKLGISKVPSLLL